MGSNLSKGSTNIMLSGDASLVVTQSAVTQHILGWKRHPEDFELAAWSAVGGAMPLPFEFFFDREETDVEDTSVYHVNLTLHVRALGDISCPSQYNETYSRWPSSQSALSTTGDMCAQILNSDMSTGFVSGAFMYAETTLIIDIYAHATQVDGIDVTKLYLQRSTSG